MCLFAVIFLGLVASPAVTGRYNNSSPRHIPLEGSPSRYFPSEEEFPSWDSRAQMTMSGMEDGIDRAEDVLNQYIHRSGVTRDQITGLFPEIKKYKGMLSLIPENTRYISAAKAKLMRKMDDFITRLLGALGVTDDYDFLSPNYDY